MKNRKSYILLPVLLIMASLLTYCGKSDSTDDSSTSLPTKVSTDIE